MNGYKLIASDLDGTFLNGEMEITPENTRAIAALRERGVEFVPASGRTFGEMDPELREHPDLRYYIYSDGAVVFDKETGEMDTACMDCELCNRIFDILEEFQVFLVAHCGGNSYIDGERMQPSVLEHHRISRYYGMILAERNRAVTGFREFYRSREEIEQIFVFFHSDDELAECRRRLLRLGEVQVLSSEPGTFEIVSACAGKGNGLLRLAKRLGIDPSQTVAVGDSCNDLSMLQAAGLSLAVSNAWEEVKAAADRTICSNDEHIVPYILEHIMKENTV
ncbi:MAG: HAD family hydrolase [Clostridia bacterium]|nr:HAD family hydrolase [Clostridia bacterium]